MGNDIGEVGGGASQILAQESGQADKDFKPDSGVSVQQSLKGIF